MTHPTLDGERITQHNAQRLVRKHWPHAICEGATSNDGRRTYFVYERGGAGAMWSGNGSTKGAAWKAAAVELAKKLVNAVGRP